MVSVGTVGGVTVIIIIVVSQMPRFASQEITHISFSSPGVLPAMYVTQPFLSIS